jgi:catechol 2,3-dioxygenase-like lactoylglutathione lyase family enzyme
MLRLDHVIMPVANLDAAARRLDEELGLGSVEGGRHEAFGTANRIVPLGDAYLEVVGVVEPEVAAATPFGQWVKAAAARGGLAAYALSTPDADAMARRLGGAVIPGERLRPDGNVLRWRLAGLQSALAEPFLPFFLTWDVPAGAHPSQERVAHRATVRGIERLEVAGDEERLRTWLDTDPAELGVHVVPGPPAVRSLAVFTDAGTLVIA